MIIGLSGYAQSGKDTVAQLLVDNYGFKRIAFADKMREMLYELNPAIGINPDGPDAYWRLKDYVKAVGWDKAKQFMEIRRLLQEFGVAGREVLGKDVWVRAAFEGIDNQTLVVVSDVRFANEAHHIKSLGGVVWRITRPGIEPANGHFSDSQLDTYMFDGYIDNNTTLDALEFQVDSLARAKRLVKVAV